MVAQVDYHKQSDSSLGWPRRTYAHAAGATAVTGLLVIEFSAVWLSIDDLGQDVGERAQ
jgi:hypothetical protein